MRWRVTGADASTGEERTVSIEAENESDAEAKALYNGMRTRASRASRFGLRLPFC